MAVGLSDIEFMAPVKGVRVGSAALGGRTPPRDDLALFELSPGSRCAATFTRNRFCAAPVTVARRHLAEAAPRYFLVNAGNANAGTAERGVHDAIRCCEMVANPSGVDRASVLPFSTGVIGEYLELERFKGAIPAALGSLRPEGWESAAHAIRTTDTVAKGVSRGFSIDGAECRINAVAKGSGMIRPDMATMLAFAATDAAVAPQVLDTCLRAAVEDSFNRITVDGDTSTNDACVLTATGAGAALGERDGADWESFRSALGEVFRRLAQAIVRDAEGGSKFVTVRVSEGATSGECLQVAYAVAESPLVKTACFASDPNWGRILAAVGRAGIADLDLAGLRIYLGGAPVVAGGEPHPDYSEEAGLAAMAGTDIDIDIRLGRGECRETVWTSDLSHEYVRINAEYRS